MPLVNSKVITGLGTRPGWYFEDEIKVQARNCQVPKEQGSRCLAGSLFQPSLQKQSFPSVMFYKHVKFIHVFCGVFFFHLEGTAGDCRQGLLYATHELYL